MNVHGKRLMHASSIPVKAITTFFATALCLLLIATCPGTARADQALHPLAPPNTSSPRATLSTFLDEMNKAVSAFKNGHSDEARAFLRRAGRCLNLEAEPPAIRRVLGSYSALYLKETLDRIDIPSFEEIPTLRPLRPKSCRVGPFLLRRLPLPLSRMDLAEARDSSLRLRPSKNQNNFSTQSGICPTNPAPKAPSTSGSVPLRDRLSPRNSWIGCHNGAKRKSWGRLRGNGRDCCSILWRVRWLCCSRLGTAARRWAFWMQNWDRAQTSCWRSYPAHHADTLAQLGLWFVVYGLHFRDVEVYLAIAFVFLLISYTGTIWLIGAILNRIAAIVIVLGRFESGGMHAQLIRFGFDVVTLVLIVGAAINLGARLGLPTYSLVTGLGVGGLAVALAGREALSNLIGTIAILLDQPFKLGDFIVLGEGDRGTVTE